METPRQRYVTRHGTLKQLRAPWDDGYRQLGQYLLPWRLKFDPKDIRRASNDSILDPTGTLALRTCAAGLAAGICSPARVWYRYGPPAALLAIDRKLAEKKTIKTYLADTEEVTRELLLRSNFYGVTSGSAFYDLPAFGTFGMFAEEDLRTVVRFKPLAIGSYWLQVDSHGEVDTIYRLFAYTVGQMAQEFGLRSCSAAVQDQFRRHQYDVRHLLLHVVEPNRRDEETGFEGARANRWGPDGMDFRSVWLEQSNDSAGDRGFLRVSGYRSFPGITPRWGRTTPEDVYGTGPGHDTLPDVKQLQTMKRRLLQMIEKQAIPPLAGPELTGGIPSQLPGAYTATAGAQEKITPIYVPDHGAVEQVRNEMQELRYAIREGLFADLWRIITDDERTQPGTAEEVRAKREERLLQLGPVTNNIEQEYLRRALDRVYVLADEAGMLPEPPPELGGMDLKVEFLSVMSEAQKAQEIPSVERVAAFIKALSELDGEVIDNLDADKFAIKYAEIAGLPPDLLRSPEAIAVLRQTRAEKRTAQEQGAALVEGAGAAKDLAGASLEGDNALARVIGGLGPVVGSQAGVSPPGLTGGLAAGVA
jgi:hypothetical protein